MHIEPLWIPFTRWMAYVILSLMLLFSLSVVIVVLRAAWEGR